LTTYGSSGMPRSDRNKDFGPGREPGEKPAECGADEQGSPASAHARHAALEKILGYTFQDRRFLEESLTHRSLMNEIPESGRRDNERLEFLGDAVLGLVIAEWVMQAFPQELEGELTRLRSALVKEKKLAEVARELNLGEFLYLGKGEEQMEGRRKRSILADAFEAIVGAIYLDGGLEAVRDFVRRTFQTLLEEAKTNQNLLTDAKTRLQELMLTLFRRSPVYEVAEERGPDHAKTFVIHLRLNDRTLARGKGGSKKEAEQHAAEQFLKNLEKNQLGLR
jgi:ribonuclease-3